MMIGSFSQIPYTQFVAALAPVALVGLAITFALLALLHRSDLRDGAVLTRLPRVRINQALIVRSLIATAIVVALFFAGQPPAKAAIIVGALLLLTRRVKSARVYAEIDWSLLLMFTGLFIIVAGAERELLVPSMQTASVPFLAVITAILSNLVSNVPAVLLLKPFVAVLPDHDRAWLVVAMASTLAGNFTVLGSIANLIVVEKAARRGVVIGFWSYFRVGAPLTLLTLLVGTLWLMWR
jgi:Na+/H+ antiporter NhaD/arsenite permease-like protein